MLPERGSLLRIFMGESDQWGGMPLYQWLVREAHREGLAGATALRGMEGFGARGSLHTTRVLTLSADLPVVVEVVDTEEKIKKFLNVVDEAVGHRLMTTEEIGMKMHRDQAASGD